MRQFILIPLFSLCSLFVFGTDSIPNSDSTQSYQSVDSFEIRFDKYPWRKLRFYQDSQRLDGNIILIKKQDTIYQGIFRKGVAKDSICLVRNSGMRLISANKSLSIFDTAKNLKSKTDYKNRRYFEYHNNGKLALEVSYWKLYPKSKHFDSLGRLRYELKRKKMYAYDSLGVLISKTKRKEEFRMERLLSGNKKLGYKYKYLEFDSTGKVATKSKYHLNFPNKYPGYILQFDSIPESAFDFIYTYEKGYKVKKIEWKYDLVNDEFLPTKLTFIWNEEEGYWELISQEAIEIIIEP